MKHPLILLHGALGSEAQFYSILTVLSVGFEVERFNFSGHHGKPFQAEFGIEQFTRELSEFIDENNFSDAYIFGYSMGGYVALNYARQNPEKITKIFTLGTKIDWNPEFSAAQVKMMNPEKMEEKIPKYAALLAETQAPNDWKILVNKTAQMMTELGNNPIPLAEFEKIEIPVMIALGDSDNLVTEEECKNLVSVLKKGVFRKIPNSKHPIEQIDEHLCLKELTRFLDISKWPNP